MDAIATAKIPCAFTQMPDPRRNNARHKLMDILTIALFAVVCGADGWAAVAEYGRAKISWPRTFLELPHGIPSHDTFGDVFARLQPEAFERCFMQWMKKMVQLFGGKLVAIDGKSLRRSFEHGWDKSGMAHVVSAFVAANRMVFAQVKTEGKGKELSAIEQLLKLLGELAGQWPGIKSLVLVERTRETNGQTSVELSYYIGSLDRRTRAKRPAQYVRGHWSVENNLHWQLDVSFREDERRIRKGHGAENFSRLCRIALNLLKSEPTAKVGVAIKRQKCGWDNDYLLKVMTP